MKKETKSKVEQLIGDMCDSFSRSYNQNKEIDHEQLQALASLIGSVAIMVDELTPAIGFTQQSGSEDEGE